MAARFVSVWTAEDEGCSANTAVDETGTLTVPGGCQDAPKLCGHWVNLIALIATASLRTYYVNAIFRSHLHHWYFSTFAFYIRFTAAPVNIVLSDCQLRQWQYAFNLRC